MKPEQAKKQQEKSSDWKSKLTAPKQDTRHKTEVQLFNLHLGCHQH